MKDIIKAAKIIQQHLEKFAGDGGGVRVWLSEYGSLHVMIWTHKVDNMNFIHEAQEVAWCQIRPLSQQIKGFIRKVTVLTPSEYEEKYFFTKPPFCEEG